MIKKFSNSEDLVKLYKVLFFHSKLDIVVLSKENFLSFKNLIDDLSIDSFCFLPSLNIYPYIHSVPPFDEAKQRIETIRQVLVNEDKTVVTTLEALLLRTISENFLRESGIKILKHSSISLEELKLKLISFGYEFVSKVSDYGECSLKGSVLDMFCPCYKLPVRMVVDFDEVASIRLFDVETQRSIEEIDEVIVLPPYENDFLNMFGKSSRNISFYELFRDKRVFSSEHYHFLESEYKGIVEEINNLYNKLPNKDGYLVPDDVIFHLPVIGYLDNRIDLFPIFISDEMNLPNFDFLSKYIFSKLQKSTFIFLSPNRKYTTKAGSIFRKYGIPYNVINVKGFNEFLEFLNKKGFADGSVKVLEGLNLPRGFETDDISVMTVKELLNREFVEYSTQDIQISSDEVKEIYLFENIKEGDYVVHSNYGIGIFRGIKEIRYFDSVKEFACIEYENGDLLYIPPEHFNLLSKYIGSEKPNISSLRSGNWKNVKQKVKESILKFSRDLLRLKAIRQIQKKEPLKVDFEEYQLLEDSFPYEETPDQIRVLEEIKSDLTSGRIMDRVICGDVGFGKTEIAVRTAFLHILNGNQVMVLVPTTILAEQHYKTFFERLSPFGVRIGVMSRLRKDSYIRKVVEGISDGSIDLVIGTHALIVGERVIDKFKKIGLVIIDEEHKFGVKHKEDILKGRENVDVLMLSATPIPRTLGMSLSNLKDISIITTPPLSRKPIKTYIVEWNDEVIRDAITREINRGGQVLIVNDKISGIENLKKRIAIILNGMLSDGDICVLHGQMNKSEIENIYFDFVDGKYKIMVSTTISESGLDIPSVNTVIINNAHLFGLADLHQIRGRVGRRDVEGYAYFIYPSKYIISELQMKRLSVIEEHSDLGAGFRIAMKDLEFRGAGNLLGKEQHGNIKTVGYVFYVRMLSETLKFISESMDEKNIVDYSDPVVYFDFGRVFPENFNIPESDKVEIMLKMNIAYTEKQINYILSEVADRYGKIPEGLYTLADIVRFRMHIKKFGIEEVFDTPEGIEIKFSRNKLPDVEKLVELISEGKYSVQIPPEASNMVVLKVSSSSVNDKIQEVLNFLGELFG
ncbi:MAG: helicase-related protein [Brevinematales bacterium]|nr:helicase-related protein [Brevinematales bacterium]